MINLAKSSRNSGRKNVRVTGETKTGRNKSFQDGSKKMTRTEFVSAIKKGQYTGYTVKKINGKPTPVSKPDKFSGNNLG